MDEAQRLAASIVHRYLTLSRYQHRFGHMLRREYGVSGQQLAVLRYLVQGAPHSVHEIGDHLCVTAGTASPLLDRMERDGLVQRYRCSDDSRKVYIEPTEKGRDIAGRAPLGGIGSMRAHLPELPVEELWQIEKALTRLEEVARVNEDLLTRKGDMA